MSSTHPKVLVVARHSDAVRSAAVREAVVAQTYKSTRLVLIHGEEDQPIFSDATSDFCPAGKLPGLTEKSGASFVLFWPDDGMLHPSAIAKLVLALQFEPGQDAVADASRASTGLWLVHCRSATLPLISLWLASPEKWIAACELQTPEFFHLPEGLISPGEGPLRSKTHPVEKFFAPLPATMAEVPELEESLR